MKSILKNLSKILPPSLVSSLDGISSKLMAIAGIACTGGRDSLSDPTSDTAFRASYHKTRDPASELSQVGVKICASENREAEQHEQWSAIRISREPSVVATEILADDPKN